MTSHLVIPDAHCAPEYDNRRFDWVGKLIIERKPEVIISLGDLCDLNSLSSYDKGHRSFEGRRFTADVTSVKNAQERIFGPLKKYNEQRKANKEKQYKPHTYMVYGNHEDRITRAIDLSPELDGLLSLDALEYTKYWDTVVPYREPLEVDGVLYCHSYASGVMGNPISGFNVGRSLLEKNHQSSTVGHCHLFDVALSVKADGQRIWGLSAGCLLEKSQIPAYAKHSARLWWRGLVYKHDVNNGDYNLELIEIDKLQRLYG